MRFGGVIYVTGTPDIADGVRRAAHDVGLTDALLTLRSYTDVVAQTRAAAAANQPAAPERPDHRRRRMILAPLQSALYYVVGTIAAGGRRGAPRLVASPAHDDLDPQRLPRHGRPPGCSISSPSRRT